jgi:hypothetical protein
LDLFRLFFKKGLSIQAQKPGLPADGPISPCLQAMAARDQAGRLLSPVGADVARLYAGRKTRVVFMHTAGSGITPWRRLIVLDADYKGEGQIKSPAKIGLVAHELTHLLQRDLRNPNYWPSGGLRPARGRRWVGDSTNFMEVVAYLIGWTIEYDLIAARLAAPDLTPEMQERTRSALQSLKNRLATLAGRDVRNATRLVIKTFPDNRVYRNNYRLENRLSDGRIPSGGWYDWLLEMGFSRRAVDHIMVIAAQGHAEHIDPVQFA